MNPDSHIILYEYRESIIISTQLIMSSPLVSPSAIGPSRFLTSRPDGVFVRKVNFLLNPWDYLQ